jgi:hypothetical protein
LDSCHLPRFRTASFVFAATLLGAHAAPAQQSGSGAESQQLPPVVVAAPEKRATATAQRRSPRRAQSAASRSSKPQPKREASAVAENPRGAIRGYVAGRSMAGTKTNTPIMQTPQSSELSRFATKNPASSMRPCATRRASSLEPSAPIRATTGF